MFTDSNRQLDLTAIEFPKKEVLKLSTVEAPEVKTSVIAKSNVWLISSIIFAFSLLVGAGIAFRIDMNDEEKDLKQIIAEDHPNMSFGSQPSNGMNHFVLEVARELHQPYAEVEFRQQSLFTYRSICT